MAQTRLFFNQVDCAAVWWRRFKFNCRQLNLVWPLWFLQDLPQEIQGSEHKAVFHQKKLFAPDKYQLESSLRPLEFLGFREVGGHALKLVLIPKREDELDEGCQVLITNEWFHNVSIAKNQDSPCISFQDLCRIIAFGLIAKQHINDRTQLGWQ